MGEGNLGRLNNNEYSLAGIGQDAPVGPHDAFPVLKPNLPKGTGAALDRLSFLLGDHGNYPCNTASGWAAGG